MAEYKVICVESDELSRVSSMLSDTINEEMKERHAEFVDFSIGGITRRKEILGEVKKTDKVVACAIVKK